MQVSDVSRATIQDSRTAWTSKSKPMNTQRPKQHRTHNLAPMGKYRNIHVHNSTLPSKSVRTEQHIHCVSSKQATLMKKQNL